MRRPLPAIATVAVALSVTVLSNPVAFGQQGEATKPAASPTTLAAPSPEELDKQAAKTQEEMSQIGQTQDPKKRHTSGKGRLPLSVFGVLLVIGIIGLLAG
jgi:hypothetical protein